MSIESQYWNDHLQATSFCNIDLFNISFCFKSDQSGLSLALRILFQIITPWYLIPNADKFDCIWDTWKQQYNCRRLGSKIQSQCIVGCRKTWVTVRYNEGFGRVGLCKPQRENKISICFMANTRIIKIVWLKTTWGWPFTSYLHGQYLHMHCTIKFMTHQNTEKLYTEDK